MTRRVIGELLAVLGLVSCAVTPAQAGPVDFGTWYEFSFSDAGVSTAGCDPADPIGPFCIPGSGTPTSFVDAPPWTTAVPAAGATLTVTDAFLSGDRFEVLDFGLPIGLTSLPTPDMDCGDDPAVCVANPAMSAGFFALVAGNHSITIVPTLSGGGGSAYFQVNTIPEPASLILFCSGLVALGLWRSGHEEARRPT